MSFFFFFFFGWIRIARLGVSEWHVLRHKMHVDAVSDLNARVGST